MTKPPYDFKFHAEIRYETEDCFNFTNANGNTIHEFKKDVEKVCKKYEKRSPKIVTILARSMYDPNVVTERIYQFANTTFFTENESVSNALKHITKENKNATTI
jgi:hypothetical protein